MADSATEKLVNDWTDKILLGLKYRKKFSDIAMWATYREWYRGNYGDELRNKIIVNRIFSQIRSMVPRTYFRSPAITVTPRRPEFAMGARVVEAVDNWLCVETGLKRTLKSSILDAGLCGIGPIKLGYDSEYGFNPAQAVDQNKGTITQAGVKSGDRIEYNANISAGMPWASRTMPDQIVTPYGWSDPHDLPWIGHMILRPLEDVKEDQKYDKKVRESLKGGFSIIHDTTNTFAHMQDADKENFCLIYEIRDVKTKKMLVICESKLLLAYDDTLQIDGLPYEFVIFNEDPEHFWPLSDVRMLKPQQVEINEIATQTHLNRRLDLVKFLYTKGALTPENLRLLTSSELEDVAAGIEISAESIQAAVQQFTPNDMSQSLIRQKMQAESDMRDTLGMSQNQMGEFTPMTSKTATETQAVAQGAAIRSDERRDVMADVLSGIMRKFNQFIFTYWDQPKVSEIVGNDGLPYWIQYTGQQIKGEYNYVIQPESGMPVTRELRHQVAAEIFKSFNNDPLIDQVQLRRLVLQQTDLIDPAYQMLIKMSPEAGQPGTMPNAPMSLQEAQNNPSVMGQMNPEMMGKIQEMMAKHQQMGQQGQQHQLDLHHQQQLHGAKMSTEQIKQAMLMQRMKMMQQGGNEGGES